MEQQPKRSHVGPDGRAVIYLSEYPVARKITLDAARRLALKRRVARKTETTA